YEDQYLKTLGKLSDGPISLVPWYDPNKKVSKVLEAALAKAHAGVSMSTNNVSPGPGIMFDAKGQNDKLKGSAIQNRGGKLVTLAPKEAANAKPEWPLKPYDKRG